ncbi:MAG: radical SAM protein [candidate division KSB1 bacterium]|nr:radical SAM protein [candidate division KSB1 bacterium]
MKPILCNYYITDRCNAHCAYCDIPTRQSQPPATECSLEDVETNLSQLKQIGVRFIDFTGGEPLLHPQLPTMLQLARKRGFYTSVTTNCLLYPRRAKEIAGLVDLLHFSLDSMDPAENDQLRGRHSFASVMLSLSIARSLGERPDLLYTVTPQNVSAIEKLARFAHRQRLMLIVNPVFRYHRQQPLSRSDIAYLDRFRDQPFVYINRALHELIRYGGNQRQFPRCRAVTATIVISPRNELLLPCYHHAQVLIPIKSHLAAILHSREYEVMKKLQGTFPFCEGCTINCYFDPSFLYKLDRFWAWSLLSKLKYGFDKFCRRH